MIKKVASIAAADLKSIRQDPMLLLTCIGPIVLIAVYQMGMPIVIPFFQQQFDLSIDDYGKIIFLVFLLMLPLLTGMVGGFLMLEERDMQLISYYAITPFGKKGYLLYRLTSPFVLTLVSVFVFIQLASVVQMPLLWSVVIACIVSLLAPLFSLFLVSYATTRVDGFALSKMASFLITAPFILFFVPKGVQWVAGVLPTFWTVKFIESVWSNNGEGSLYGLYALLIHLLFIWYFYRKFQRSSN